MSKEQKDWTENVRWADDRQALRDDFAKAAMQGLITNEQFFDYLRENTADSIAHDAYIIAEAMMHERERRMKG